MAVQITPVLRKTGYECCGKQTLVRAPRGFPTLYRFECSEHGFYPSTFDGTEIDKDIKRTYARRAKTVGLGGSRGSGRLWTNAEDDLVLEHSCIDQELAFRIRRSEEAIVERRRRLLGRTAQ
jgi:hypothetical protein